VDSTISPFTAVDGENIALADWPVHPDVAPRAVIVVVHGLGEHVWRYYPLALELNKHGFAVRGYDQYGHGESGGVQGALPSETRLVDDLSDVLSDTARVYGEDTPIVLMGHSMGGVVAAGFVRLRPKRVQGLVLSSPALQLRLSGFQRWLLGFMPQFAPNFSLSNGLKPKYLSHDEAVVAQYRNDRLVHDRITPRLAQFIVSEGAAVRAAAPNWSVPTLMVIAGDDQIVQPDGARAFAKRVPTNLLQTLELKTAWHEVFNELPAYRNAAIDALVGWLDARFAPTQRPVVEVLATNAEADADVQASAPLADSGTP
jgi:alpha-beta hydrolase superfamily lysophospholipase